MNPKTPEELFVSLVRETIPPPIEGQYLTPGENFFQGDSPEARGGALKVLMLLSDALEDVLPRPQLETLILTLIAQASAPSGRGD